MCTIFVLYACMFNSRRICAQFLYSDVARLVCDLCLHIQFPWDMCTISILYRIYAYIFNSRKICAWILCSSFLTCLRFRACMFNSHRICARILSCLTIFWMKDPLRILEDSLVSIILLRSVLVMIPIYHEVLMVYGPLGRG